MDDAVTTRRGLLRAGAVLAAAAGAGVLTAAPAAASARRPPVRRTPGPQRRTRPVLPAPAPGAPGDLRHLLLRTTYGLTPALLAEATALGPAAWLDRQLAPSTIEDSACDAVVARFPAYAMDPPQVHATYDDGSWEPMLATVRTAFVRACWSRRQLLEVMVEFWSNHLNTTAPSSGVWSSKGFEDRTVIRPHALGRFSDLLLASASSPAMLRYLDGAESRGSDPNENYGRELLELHTVGRDAGYTQAEVVDTARALTGRTTWTPWNGGTAANLGLFGFRADWHHVGPLAVLGWTSANTSDGQAVGDSLLRHLATHPATAARIAHKLCVRFVSDDPPAALVARLAQVYLASGTAVVPVLRALFASPEFAASAGGKQRRPYEDVVASVRVLGIEPAPTGTETRGIADVCWGLHELGQAPFGWHPPDGYPDVAAAWTGTGTALGRWNLHTGLAQGWWQGGLRYPGATLAARLLPGPLPATRAELVARTADRLTVPLPQAHLDALVTFLGGPGPVREWDLGGVYSVLVALVLDSPLWSAR